MTADSEGSARRFVQHVDRAIDAIWARAYSVAQADLRGAQAEQARARRRGPKRRKVAKAKKADKITKAP